MLVEHSQNLMFSMRCDGWTRVLVEQMFRRGGVGFRGAPRIAEFRLKMFLQIFDVDDCTTSGRLV